jgi:cytochrome c peroxidase
MKFTTAIFITLLILGIGMSVRANETWSEQEIAAISKLWINNLGSLPASPTNRVADDARAAEFGKKLFFDKTLSEDGSVACSTCHDPEQSFTDAKPLAEGRGTAPRNTPSIIGAAYHRFQFWDGRADSLWSQALGPFESAAEHGTNRMFVARTVFSKYLNEYETIFPRLPYLGEQSRIPKLRDSFENPEVQAAWNAMLPNDQQVVLRIFTNVGKSIEAYERSLIPSASTFDRFAESLLETGDAGAVRAMPEEAQAGLKLFIGKAGCVQCHSGPMLTDEGFHNTGVPINEDLARPDFGRSLGVTRLLGSGFNCLSSFSDAPNGCADLLELQKTEKGFKPPLEGANDGVNSAIEEVNSANTTDDRVDANNTSGNDVESPLFGAFKTPSLRNVALTAPYMHAGQFENLSQVINHYRFAPKAVVGKNELQSIPLEVAETKQLIAFLNTLNSPLQNTSLENTSGK